MPKIEETQKDIFITDWDAQIKQEELAIKSGKEYNKGSQ